MTEARYRGTKIVTVTPDYSEASKFADLWLHPKQGTDAALAHGDGPCDPERVARRGQRRLLHRLLPPLYRHADAGDADARRTAAWSPDRQLRAADLADDARPGQQPGLEDRRGGRRDRRALCRRPARSASAGASRASGTSRAATARTGDEITPRLSLAGGDDAAAVDLPVFRRRAPSHSSTRPRRRRWSRTRADHRRVHAEGRQHRAVATVYDLFLRQLRRRRG